MRRIVFGALALTCAALAAGAAAPKIGRPHRPHPTSTTTVAPRTSTTSSTRSSTTTTTTPVPPLAFELDCAGATHATITLADVAGVSIRHCQFAPNAFIQLTRVTDALIDSNIFTADTDHSGISITDTDGARNTITNNVAYGAGAAIGCCFVGYDDGLVLQNVNHDVVQHNTFNAYFDCAIETLGTVTDTLIDANTSTDARTCGIGGWYDLDWQHNIVTNNTVTGSQLMFRFFWKQNQQIGGHFTDNQFTGNVSSHMLTTAQNSIFQTDVSMEAARNMVSGNDFAHGEQFAPQFSPVDAFTGTGNLCGARSQSGGSLVCPG